MATLVLATKLYIPPPPARVVARSRLIQQLNEGLALGRKLTLISTSAGFGKTTLASEWIQTARQGDKETRRGGDASSPYLLVSLSSLLIHGDFDLIPVASSEYIQQQITDSHLVVIEQSGHFPFVEQPEKFMDTVQEFLSEYK